MDILITLLDYQNVIDSFDTVVLVVHKQGENAITVSKQSLRESPCHYFSFFFSFQKDMKLLLHGASCKSSVTEREAQRKFYFLWAHVALILNRQHYKNNFCVDTY